FFYEACMSVNVGEDTIIYMTFRGYMIAMPYHVTYVRLGAFHKPVKCYVMDVLYEVDLILGEEFMTKYDCILHYGKGCIIIKKGKRHMTVNSTALPRSQPPVDEEKSDSVLSASQSKR